MLYNTYNHYQDGRTMVKGNYSMSFYQQLINTIDSLIRCKGKYDKHEGYSLTFDELTEDEQGELVVLQLEDDNRDTSDCFRDPNEYAKDDNITSALIKMLQHNTTESYEDFANAVRERSINCYRNKLGNLIDDRCGWVTQEFNDSRGFDE